MRFKNPFTKNYDCHCGSRSATICRFRHWIDGQARFRSSTAFLCAMAFLAFASGAPNKLNGCKKISEDVEQRHEYVERVREYNYAYPSPITEEDSEVY